MAGVLDDVKLRLVEDIEDLFEFKRWVGERRETPLAVDTETGGLNPFVHRLRLVQFGDLRTGWAIPWDLWKGGVLEIIKGYEGEWVCHNLPFEQKFFKVHGGVQLPWERCHDTMVQAKIDDPLRPASLKWLADRMVDRTATQGQKALHDGMQAQGWTWDTVPMEFGPYWCVPKTTEILTRRGWLRWDEVEIGDETLGYQNGTNIWTKITRINTPGIAETVRLGNKHWSVICTPDHRWVMQKGTSGEIQTIPLIEGWKDKGTTKLILSAPASGGENPLTPDEAAILAWFLSDGHIRWQRPKTFTSPIAHIIQKPGPLADKIRDLLKREGAYVSERLIDRSQCLSFYVSSPYVTELWRRAGLRENSLMDLVLGLSSESRSAWVEAWIDAEGTKGTQIVSQKDGPKAEALAVSLYLEGYSVDIQTTYDGVHRFHYTKRRPTPQKTKITANGPVDVWCPTTEIGTWTARDESGNIFLTGNCYGALDPVLTAHVHQKLHKPVTDVAPRAYALEMAVLRICTAMSLKGMLLDVPYVHESKAKLQQFSQDARAWLKSTHGITSPMSGGQLSRAFEGLGCEITEYTDSGAPKMDKAVLEFFKKNASIPEARQLAEYTLAIRHTDKIIGSYLDNFLNLRDSDDLIHANIGTMAARTGRMSVTDPALQTLHRDDKIVRGSFVPHEGNVFLSCDLDQVEARFGAHYADDAGLIEAFRAADTGGADFFCGIASEVYNEEISKEDPRRTMIKSVVYGSLYGAGPVTMAETAKVPLEQMTRVKEAFDGRFPGLSRALEDTEREAKAAGRTPYIRSALGHRLTLEQGREYTQGLNARIQGNAAAYFKQTLVDMDACGLGDNLVLPVHDEALLEVPAGDAEEALKLVEQCMTNRTDYKVPITAGGKIMRDRWVK